MPGSHCRTHLILGQVMAWPESQTAFPPEGAQGCGAGYAWAGEALLASVARACWVWAGSVSCALPYQSLLPRTWWSWATGYALVHSIRVSARWKVLWRLRANCTQTGTGTLPRPGLGSQAPRRKAGGRGVLRVGRALSNFSLENMQDWPPARD